MRNMLRALALNVLLASSPALAAPWQVSAVATPMPLGNTVAVAVEISDERGAPVTGLRPSNFHVARAEATNGFPVFFNAQLDGSVREFDGIYTMEIGVGSGQANFTHSVRVQVGTVVTRGAGNALQTLGQSVFTPRAATLVRVTPYVPKVSYPQH
jgi:hypothetical protein